MDRRWEGIRGSWLGPGTDHQLGLSCSPASKNQTIYVSLRGMSGEEEG